MEKLSGRVQGLLRRRATRDFVMGEIGGAVGTTATAASFALAGMGGAAVSTAFADSNEEADYVEFDLEGRRVKGWFWRFPFSEGDELDVAAEKLSGTQGNPDQWVAYGARRRDDGIVAVYPHCHEGTVAHRRASLRFYAWFAFACYLVGACFSVGFTLFSDHPDRWATTARELFLYLPGVMVLVYGFLGYRATRKLAVFPQLAEEIFRTFGWPDPSRISLRKTSRAKRGEKETGDYGYFFFRY
ncbi:hypothetical protein BER2_0867 [plant metagenome]|nr:putative type VI secretion system effector [Orrella dioscoreae]